MNVPQTNMKWSKRIAIVTVTFVVMIALGMSDFLRPIENAGRNASFSIRQHAASQQLHIVEMDAASIATIDRWPWSRTHYADVVDRLNEAGVRSIVFDVDFSSPSNPLEDSELAAAIARSEARIVMPTFAQVAGSNDTRSLDSLPIEKLRKYAALGSVSVQPDPDGLVRQMPLGTITDEVPRPSLSAQIAQRSGAADAEFPIDYAIDPQTIPRHSFIAVENGRLGTADLRDRDVLIGATAIELGDRYTVPTYGILPGVVVQALAAETLYRGIPHTVGWMAALIMSALLAFLILSASTNVATVGLSAASGAIIVIGQYAMRSAFLIVPEIAPALAMIAVVCATQISILIRREIMAKRMIDSESGLPNGLALQAAVKSTRPTYTVTAMIDDFDALKSVIDPNAVGILTNRLADRLSMGIGNGVIYRLNDRVLAWTAFCEHYELEDTLLGMKGIMRSPIEIGGRRVDVNLAYGIAEAGNLMQAVHAASVAQREGLHWRYHQHAERAALEQQLSLMGEMDQAIENGELQVLYQPKLNLQEDRITSVEALVRWNHPARGFLRPDSFIPLAEQNDRIADLTMYVLERTIADLGEWHSRGLVIKAAVNISARLVTSASFIAAAETTLNRFGVPRDRLIFEVTESAAMDDPEAAVAALNRFRALGVTISMDDYGTGQSSLTYLKNLPLSELKIDRSFVQFAHRDQNDGLLVRSTVQLAHSLGLQVVAEGVEDEECLDFLRQIECDLAQGYHIGKPMEADKLAELALRPTALAA